MVQQKLGSSILHNSVPSGFKNSEFHGCLIKFHSDTKFPGNLPKHHTLEICHKYSFEKNKVQMKCSTDEATLPRIPIERFFFLAHTEKCQYVSLLKGKIISVHSAT